MRSKVLCLNPKSVIQLNISRVWILLVEEGELKISRTFVVSLEVWFPIAYLTFFFLRFPIFFLIFRCTFQFSVNGSLRVMLK
jgi:hypothetical protein